MHAFIVAIRQMANNCQFSSMLDNMIRDQIVCVIRSKSLQKHLLAKKDFSFTDAEALALAAEIAELDSQGISADKEQANVLQLLQRSEIGSKKKQTITVASSAQMLWPLWAQSVCVQAKETVMFKV